MLDSDARSVGSVGGGGGGRGAEAEIRGWGVELGGYISQVLRNPKPWSCPYYDYLDGFY